MGSVSWSPPDASSYTTEVYTAGDGELAIRLFEACPCGVRPEVHEAVDWPNTNGPHRTGMAGQSITTFCSCHSPTDERLWLWPDGRTKRWAVTCRWSEKVIRDERYQGSVAESGKAPDC